MGKAVFIFSITILCISCSSIRKQTRAGKDIKITRENFKAIESCSSDNALLLHRLLTEKDDYEENAWSKYSICIIPIDKKHINVDLIQDSVVISSTKVKGHYNNGYFNIRRWNVDFMKVPIIWILTDQLTCLGINKEGNKLVVIYTTGGQMLFVLFPIMASQGGDAVYEFERTK